MKKIFTLVLVSMFALTIFIGCTEESQYTTFPETGNAQLNIIDYSVETHYQTQQEAESSDRTARIRSGFYHDLPDNVDPLSVSYWTEIQVYNQYDQFIHTVKVTLTFLDDTGSELFTLEKLSNEGLNPGDVRWITVTTFKHKEEYDDSYDFTRVSDVAITVTSAE